MDLLDIKRFCATEYERFLSNLRVVLRKASTETLKAMVGKRIWSEPEYPDVEMIAKEILKERGE